MRTISVRFGYIAAVVGIAGLFQVYNAPISTAAPNPDSCFTTTGTTSRTITDYNPAGVGCGLVVEIPSTIGGDPVTSIAGFSFNGDQLTSLTIPNSVTSIGDGAFGNNQLTTVTIPNSVTTVGAQAFAYNLLTTVTIPNSVTSIGNGAFYTNQLTTVTIPSLVTSIGDFAFHNNQLSSVTIPNSVTSIGDSAFGNNQLTAVTIPSLVTSIGANTFGGNQLTSVTIPNSVTNIGDYAFSLQSPSGGDIWNYISDPDIAIAQAAVDSIWYVRLYTADPSNPQAFTDNIGFETAELDGLDNDYDEVFINGGYLVNPTSAELQFVDGSNNQLLAPIVLTGQTTNGITHFYDYIVSNGPNIPFPVDPYSPTAPELQAARTALSQYYRAGSTLSYTASLVSGVTPTPASYSFVLGASTASNQRQFVYATTSATAATGALANTGISIWLVAAAASIIIIGSLAVLARR